jgi:AsmA-like C-terminal region/AsmA family
MKKATGIILKVFIGLILIILVSLFTIPIIFKKQIKIKVEQAITSSVNATVKFDDYKLGFFKDFPNLSFSLRRVSVTGVGKFEGDTLAGFNSFDLVFNLLSLFKKTGYEVKSVAINRAVINAIVKKEGNSSTANWDIMKNTSQVIAEPQPQPAAPPKSQPAVTPQSRPAGQSQPQTASQSRPLTSSKSQPAITHQSQSSGSQAGMKIRLKKVTVTNSSFSYIDDSSKMKVYLDKVNFTLTGDMTTSQTDLQVAFNAGDFSFIMNGTRYINKAVLDSKIDLIADLAKRKFTFRENYFSLNDLKLNFTGTVEMPGNNIATDIKFATAQTTSFKTLLSLIPSVYMKDYKDLKATGDFSLSGSATGIYSDADSTLPDVTLAVNVSNGLVKYPALPDQLQNINIKSDIFVNGKKPDNTIINIDQFHMELAGNPLDMTLTLKTPVSDPDFKGSMVGRVDLGALYKAVPLNGTSLSGIINISVQMAGKMSMIKKNEYDKFKASGTIGVKNMDIAITGYPDLKINEGTLEFTPAYAALSGISLIVGGKSDFNLKGRIENYIPYFLSNKTIKGNLTSQSKQVDASDIMSKMSATTPPVKRLTQNADPNAGVMTSSMVPSFVRAPVQTKVSSSDAAPVTARMKPIQIPGNIDFDIDAKIDNFNYNDIKARKVQGHLIVRNGILSIKDAEMDILNGNIKMNADYDTRDTLKPMMKADLDIENIGVRDAFNTFNTVKKLAPAADEIDGKISAKINYVSQLGKDMMPVTNSINGSGVIKSSEITLLESKTFDQMKEVLKLGDNYSKTFKDINISFRIADGRVYVSPFDVKTGNLKMNISGDQGLDQTINYIVKTELPRSDLGSSVNSFIDKLSAEAAAFGIKYKPADVLKLNVKVTGTYSKPVVSPYFGNTGK